MLGKSWEIIGQTVLRCCAGVALGISQPAQCAGRLEMVQLQNTSSVALQVPGDATLPWSASLDPGATGQATAISPCSPLVLDVSRSVWINEIHYDNLGKDDREFIEVAGVAGTDLSRWRLVLYNGENGEAYDTLHLAGTIPSQQCGFGAMAFDAPGLQNGVLPGYVRGDGIALVLDPWDQVVEFISYEGAFAAFNGPAAGMVSQDLAVAELDGTPPGESIQRAAGFESLTWAGPSTSSPGTINPEQVIWPCDGAVVISHLDTFRPGSCARKGSITRTWTARDSCGNSASLPQAILLTDNNAPQFAFVPPDATVACGQPADPPNLGLAIAVDDGDMPGGLNGAWINEIHYNDSGDQDFVEIAGTAGTDLVGYALAYYQSSGARYGGVQFLSGLLLEEGDRAYGALVFHPKAVTGIGLRNGPGDGLALVHLPTRQVVQFISYGRPLTAVNGPAAGLPSIEIGSAAGLGLSLQLTGEGPTWPALRWDVAAASPGLLNPAQSLSAGPKTTVTFVDHEEPAPCVNQITKTITRVWTATDACGNQITRSSLMYVQDQTAPHIVGGCAQSSPVLVENDCVAQVPNLLSSIVAEDACASTEQLSLEQEPAPGTPIPSGESISVRITVSDPCGNVSEPCLVSVTAPETLTLTSGKTDATCSGAADGTMTVWFEGGIAPYELKLDGADYAAGPSPVILRNLEPGPHMVVVQDAAGCVAATTQTVLSPPAWNAEIVAAGPTAFCGGQNVTLTASSGASYVWSNGAVSQSVTVDASGAYYVTVRDANGCSSVSPVIQVTVHSPPQAAILASGPTTLCSGESVTLTASPGASYLWSNEAITPSITVRSGGVYQVIVTDQSGCQSSAAVSIVQNEAVSLVYEKQDITCHGAKDGHIRAWSKGGEGPYQFSLNNEPRQSDGTFTGIGPGLHSVTIVDRHGCTAKEQMNVHEPPVLAVSLSKTDATCARGSEGALTVEFSGGIPPYALSLNNSAVAVQSSPFTFSGLSPGSYSVVVRDANGCDQAVGITLGIRASSLEAAALSNQSVCTGESATFTTAAIGTGVCQFSWSGPTGPLAPGTRFSISQNATASTLTIEDVNLADAGMYLVTVTDACGESVEQTASLTVFDPVQITSPPQNQEPCLGGKVTFEVGATGDGLLSYQWRKDGENIPSAQERRYTIDRVTAADAGTYEVVITGQCGSALGRATVTIDSVPPLILESPLDRAVAAAECEGTVPDLTGEVVVTDDCTPSHLLRRTQDPPPGSPLRSGETLVTLTLQDASGNSSTAQCKLTLTEPIPAIQISDHSVFEGDLGSMHVALTVTLSSKPCRTVTIEYATDDAPIDRTNLRGFGPGSMTGVVAMAGLDYTAAKGSLVFGPGETEKTISVLVHGDRLREPDERFFVTLSAPVNATIEKSHGIVLITDDDPLPLIGIEDIRVTEGDQGTTAAIFTVSLSEPTSEEVRVDFTAENGTASAPEDFIPSVGTLHFRPWTLEPPRIAIERAGGQIALSWRGITEGCALQTCDSLSRVGEWRNLTNSSIAGRSGQTTLNAESQSQFYRVILPAAVGVGEMTQSVTLWIQGDTRFEADETFWVNLSGVTNAMLGKARALATITDDDASNRPNQAPTVRITSPQANTIFLPGSDIVITATAVDLDGSVVRVDFYADGTRIGTATNSPYTLQWTNVTKPGEYSLRAEAIDDRQGSDMSSPVVITVDRAAADVAIVRDHDDLEISAMRGYLLEVGLTSTVFDVGSLTREALKAFKLIIWDDLGDVPAGFGNEVVQLLQEGCAAGIPIYFIGERLASAADDHTVGREWIELIHLQGASVNPADGTIRTITAGNHRVINGRFGLVESFPYPAQLEAATRFGPESVLLARSGDTDVLLAWESPTTGARTVTQNFLTLNHSESAHAIDERKRLFLNSVWWLLRRPICGLTDLTVNQAANPERAVVGNEFTYTLTVQRSGECEATGVVVTVVLPLEVEFVSAWTPQGTWSESDGMITFQLGLMDEVALALTVTVIPTAPGEVTSVVRVRGNEREPNLENNSSTVTMRVWNGAGQ